MRKLSIGVTATHLGMSDDQRYAFLEGVLNIMEHIPPRMRVEFHHGDCVGGDADAHGIMAKLRKFHYPNIYIIVHPPTDPKARAFVKDADEVRPEKPYLERNHDIVDESDVLFVAPATNREVLRSGTWATYRYAQKQNKDVKMLRR